MKVAVNVSNCESHAEEFGRTLANALGIKSGAFQGLNKGAFLYRGDWLSYRNLATNLFLDVIWDCEKAIIEKVGEDAYGRELSKIFNAEFADLWRTDDIKRMFAKIATASASQRLVACLLALGVEEVEETVLNRMIREDVENGTNYTMQGTITNLETKLAEAKAEVERLQSENQKLLPYQKHDKMADLILSAGTKFENLEKENIELRAENEWLKNKLTEILEGLKTVRAVDAQNLLSVEWSDIEDIFKNHGVEIGQDNSDELNKIEGE